MRFKTILIKIVLIGIIFSAHSKVFSAQLILEIDSIYTISPKQVIKEVTASNYIYLAKNDFDRDGAQETIVGANCIEGFCENYIFKHLNNKRYQYLGTANFEQDRYELVWKNKVGLVYPDIIFFKLENIGQGCLGRYQYIKSEGYKLTQEVCRLPRIVAELLSTNSSEKNKTEQPAIKEKDPDFIDFSNIKYNDKPEDFFPDEEAN